MNGIGIRGYKPSEFRDWEKMLVGIAGLKNPFGDPFYVNQHAACDFKIS